MERILDAAEEVVTRKGFENATVSEIVRRARSSVGAFYARFRDKDSLLNLLHERFFEEAMATSDAALDPAAWQGANIAEILSELIPFLVRTYREREGLIRAFIIRGVLDDSFAQSACQLYQHMSQRLSVLLLERQHEIAHPEPKLAIELGFRLVASLLDQGALASNIETLTGSLDDDVLAGQLIRAYLCYLGIEPPLDLLLSRGTNGAPPCDEPD